MKHSQAAQREDPRALVADDDAGIRLTLSALLEQKGFAVTAVDNGIEALEAVRSNEFDIALLDIRMPQMDGFEACKSIRELENGRNLPILMLTGQDDAESIEMAFDAGATDFVAKPINYVLMGYRIDYILRATGISEELRKSQQRSLHAQRIANLGHIEWSPALEIVHCSDGVSEILGLSGQAAFSSLDDFIEFVHPEDRGRVETSISHALANGEVLDLEHRIVRPDGSVRFVLQITEARPNPVSTSRMVVTLQDITDRIDTEKRMHALAYYDDLTGLPNRRLLIQHLDQLLKGAQRYEHKTAVIVFGVDRFDKVVESLDHHAVENLIKLIAERIKSTCRECDLLSRQPPADPEVTGDPEVSVDTDEEAGLQQLTAKLRNDEYVIVLSAVDSLRAASVFLQRLMERFRNAFEIDGRKVFVTTSAGISLAPIDGNSPNMLIRYAEIARGVASEEGAGSFHYFRQELDDQIRRKFALADDLRKALKDNRLEVHYQPKIRLSDRALVGVEALCRWQHPSLGSVSPMEFIQIAEDEGLIGELGYRVLETACAQLAAWRTEFDFEFGVSVNVSAAQLHDDEAMQRIVDFIANCPIDNRLIEFELTESTLLENFDASLFTLNRLTDMGCSLAIDDFGTGYSALSYLGKLPASTLKIDKSFVHLVESNSQYAAIVGGVIKLAHSLGLTVVAEGVETDLQKAFLSREQCDQIQGSLAGLPMPPCEFDDWLRAWHERSSCAESAVNE